MQVAWKEASFCIEPCRHGNRRGRDFAQWPKGVNRNRPHCFGTRRSLAVGRGRLFSSFGIILAGDTKLGAAKLQTGDCLMLQVGTVCIRGGDGCFAAI